MSYHLTMALSKHRLQHAGIDADEILPNLWQGSAPPLGSAVKISGFDMLILCAEEYQPRAREFGFRSGRVLHAPLDDHTRPLEAGEWETILTAAEAATVCLRRGGRVLVTCAAGRNRSGIVTALTIILLTRCSPKKAVRLVRSRRDLALTNDSFVRHIEALA